MDITPRARALYDQLATGWNTWDVRSVTAHVLLPDQLRINLSFFITHLSAVARDHAWDEVESFGEHAADGSYTCVTVRLREAQCRVETAAIGRELLLRVQPVAQTPNYFVALSAQPIWQGALTIGYGDGEIWADGTGGRHIIRQVTSAAQPSWDPIAAHHLTADANRPAYFSVNSNRDAAQIDEAIDQARTAWLAVTIGGEGALEEALGALRRCLLWNTVYDAMHRRVVSPVSRNWCRNNGAFGDYVVFGWDTFFAGLMMGLIDRDLAYANIFSILEEITPEGMVPNLGSGCGWSRDRSEPQVGSLCVWKLYLQYGDRWFVEECYPHLLAWNRWRFENRDKNGDGLMELASTPWALEPEDQQWGMLHVGEKQGAMWESGLDNSPMWDRARFNAQHHCLEMSYVGLNALMVADCQLLAKMAALLGREEDLQALRAQAEALGARINDGLWSEAAGCYLNRHWSGEFDPCLSLTHFYPLIAGIVPPERMEALVNGHLLNPKEFWGEYPVPNVSYTDPAFPDQDYWRGRVWAPTNFLIAEGLTRAGLKEARAQLAQKGLSMYLKCWRERGVVGENYNALTGEAAEPGASSDRFYHWGALLVYLALEERVRFDAWSDQMVTHPEAYWVGAVRNLPVLGGRKITV